MRRTALHRLFPLLSLIFLSLASSNLQADVSYKASIQPLFENKCVACHACNDAPCQLNLGSGEGVLRGATKIKVYDGTRTKTQYPTRLFTDAHGLAEWQQKGFTSVLGNGNPEASLLARMIELGHANIPEQNSKLPASIPIGTDVSNQCPLDEGEWEKFQKKYPERGMPLGVTGLTNTEYNTLKKWLAEGAKVDSEPRVATAEENVAIADWEKLLNRSSLREQLVARWLYEHLFLAHLYFDNIKNSQFFEVVRSRTPPGQTISVIATAQPNDDPAGKFYYRLRPVQGSIVHKTHITHALNAEKIARIEQLFFSSNWKVDKLPGYGTDERANPFITFSAIPARARYQFMLDNAEYFVRTFIRGPVCRGNIATDVIRDNFWTFFQSPDSDLYITNAEHRHKVDPMLGVPGQKERMRDLFPQWTKYTKLRNEYTDFRTEDYLRHEPKGAKFSDIWNGDGTNDNAILSIYRHHDSASVRKGLWGEIPQTLWWMDYPLFERTYYSLVVNFNVYDTVSHQAQTRLYFDLIRHGAETNFLRLLPATARKPLMSDWYQNSGKLKMWLYYPSLDTDSPSAIAYTSKNAEDEKREFANLLLGRFEKLNARPDPINRCTDGNCARKDQPEWIRKADQAVSRLAARPGKGMPAINFLPESTMLRVYKKDGEREIYTILRNRAHSNVAYMAAESLRYQPDRDTLTIYPGVLTSYPNFAFNVPAAEISDFALAMQAASNKTQFEAIVQRWGVRRTHPDFWIYFHDYTAYIREHEPVETAILDMNRYENL
ncbi:MAG: fatty acid cis/trans isomerase [Pedobacter sp.]|nr:fatty acid cis/trans isomerase [Pedobacter sp.]